MIALLAQGRWGLLTFNLYPPGINEAEKKNERWNLAQSAKAGPKVVGFCAAERVQGRGHKTLVKFYFCCLCDLHYFSALAFISSANAVLDLMISKVLARSDSLCMSSAPR